MANNIRNLSKSLVLSNEGQNYLTMGQDHLQHMLISDFRHVKIVMHTESAAVLATVKIDGIQRYSADIQTSNIVLDYDITDNKTLDFNFRATQGGRKLWYTLTLN